MLIKEKLILESKIVQKPGCIVSDMDGEKVMLNIDNGNYYNLGKMGGVIWEMIKEPISVDELINYLLLEYDVDKMDCENQVILFINKLNSEDLISVVNR
ncbi:lasso peptide biosynthesis PqqD family chaperone [Mesobacillus subterraneus]|uniref:lasso peptide biosynthesis PqqD family chaperone n=1 Tax=Mesobacillus subterraneus TaxID=285983 RepID=UPI002040DC26|nr:lasso peptide biosynthesis PqqD family chaperone [Mesobacillus subterraneus]MCM3665216.1 lasso peptide biosynthesis PqqD family chaperone [Mesobacillus subterraneus]MCM3684229.1 lasso peptide biosynthesis PqqD family chaperone [Mesobacillus subterraneus]